MPALQATRIDLLGTIRGVLTRRISASRARNALIVVQVTASALLLICAGIFLRSALRSAASDSGLRVADTIVIDVNNEPYRGALIAAAAATPSVAAVAASWPGAALDRPRAAIAGSASDNPTVLPDAGTARWPVGYRLVSSEYFNVLGIALTAGRVFTQAEARANATVAVVSEATAQRFWPGADAVGQLLYLEPDQSSDTRRPDEPALPSRTFEVVGVVRNVAGFRLAGFDEAGVYLPADLAAAETALILRVHGDPDVARAALLDRLTAIDPNLGQVLTVRTLARLESYPLQVAFWLTVILGGLALFLTLSGIFSVLSYLVEQRAKEIGVRIALGATTTAVTSHVLGQSLRLVGTGLAAGAVLAGVLATVFAATPVAARIGAIVNVFDPLAFAASPLVIVVACVVAASIPALRAARINPIDTLRQE
jgi:hypothetical protein